MALAAPLGAAQGTVRPTSGRVARLQDLVAEAVRANSGIRAAALRAAALRDAAPAAGALPDPSIAVGWMGSPAPFVVNNSVTSNRSLAVKEMFPFPGKLRLRRQAARANAAAADWRYRAAVRTVTSELKAAYYSYAFSHQALAVTRSNRALLEQLTRIAEARYESGKGLQQDVLRGQVELSRLLGRIDILTARENMAAARINALLNRDASAPLGAPEPLAQAHLTYTLPQLQRLAAQHDTRLGEVGTLIGRDQKRVALAHKAYEPDFTVGYEVQHMAVTGMLMAGATVSVNIPLFYRSKQRPELRAAVADLNAEQASRDDRRAALSDLVREQYLAAQQAQQLAVLYARAIVPQSVQALQSAQMAYQAGTADFLTLLDDFSGILDDQVNYDQQVAAYDTALARLEPLVGVELTQ